MDPLSRCPQKPPDKKSESLWFDIVRRTGCTPERYLLNTAKMMLMREGNHLRNGGSLSAVQKTHILNRYVPRNPSTTDHGPRIVFREPERARGYVTHFSRDGTRLLTGFQNHTVRIHDVENSYNVLKHIQCNNIVWTVTDAHLSPTHRFLAYSTISPVIQMVNISHDGHELKTDLEVSDTNLGIWSFKFSEDGSEVVAGASDSFLYVYDVERKMCVKEIDAHKNDINSVAFTDESSNVIASGSDDTLIKLWDRRTLNANGRASGSLPGHLEGISYISSKGDGRYIVSNGKDQCAKLWDIRKMITTDYVVSGRGRHNWDYRWAEYPGSARLVHPDDQSIATFRGHEVLETLIRVHFAPESCTGQRYIYSGSRDGVVYVYDIMTGKTARKLCYHAGPVRDVTWHPTENRIVSLSWDGRVAEWTYENELSETDLRTGEVFNMMSDDSSESRDEFDPDYGPPRYEDDPNSYVYQEYEVDDVSDAEDAEANDNEGGEGARNPFHFLAARVSDDEGSSADEDFLDNPTSLQPGRIISNIRALMQDVTGRRWASARGVGDNDDDDDDDEYSRSPSRSSSDESSSIARSPKRYKYTNGEGPSKRG